MCNKFRPLTADEVECRAAQVGRAKSGPWVSLLIYKDARVDQKLLDEVVGPMNWQNSYELIDGKLFCTVSIWDEEKKVWISKQNVGTESNTEKEKGQASDAFKRACFNFGIGRELYTSPKIFITLSDDEYDAEKNRCKASFSVSEMESENDRITKLVIVDSKKKVRFSYGSSAKVQSVEKPIVVENPGVMTKEQFRDRWNSDEHGGGITFDDIADCAKAWGIDSKPKIHDIMKVRAAVLKAAGCSDDAPETFVSIDGKVRMTEGDKNWKAFVKRVASDEVCQDGMPLSLKIRDYYNLPEEVMQRFYAEVDKTRKK